MPRTPSFSPEEDAIVLATSGQSAEHTNEMLMAGGYVERTPSAIKQRRYYLRNNLAHAGVVNSTQLELTKELARQQSLQAELAKLEDRRNELLSQVRQSSESILALMQRVAADLETTPELQEA